MQVSVEPHLIALGPGHVAIAVNDRAWIHEVNGQGKDYHFPVNM